MVAYWIRLPSQEVFQGSFAVRPLSAASAGEQAKRDNERRRSGGQSEEVMTVEDERFSAITDQIPQRPMGVVEGTSYTVIILAGIAVAGRVQEVDASGTQLPPCVCIDKCLFMIDMHPTQALGNQDM